MEPLLVIIAGPTGSGKTRLAIKLALKLGCSILCADSRQVFKELKIGSAAPTDKERRLVKHFFAGSHSIHDEFNAGKFEHEALKCLNTLFTENPIQLVSGGSGLYLDALLRGFDEMPKVDPLIRERLILKYKETGLDFLRNELLVKDPLYYNQVDLNNPQRIIRALEIIEHSGLPYSDFRIGKNKSAERPFKHLFFAINPPREVLYQQINERVNEMMQAGWIEEAKNLVPFRNLNSLQTLGYTELFDYFDGTFTMEETISRIQQSTRRYAKRQLTWLRSTKDVIWLEGNEDSLVAQVLLEIEKIKSA